MRWKKKEIPKLKAGDIRIRSFFTLAPFRIGEDVRWLERVTIKEELWFNPDNDDIFDLRLYWMPEMFIDEPEQN